jgi:hypothetical protein
MSLVVVMGEIEKTLEQTASEFAAGPYRMGLYKNDHTPSLEDVIASFDAADFGGYDGERDLPDWDLGGLIWDGFRWTVTHPDVVWEADGTSSNSIYGYYVVDQSGNLAWAERRTDGAVTIGAAGQTYTVSPRFTRRSEFGE